MEIAPIPGIRELPALRAQQGDFRPPAIFDIDASAKAGDSAGDRSRRKAAGAEEDGEEELVLDGEIEIAGEQLEEVAARQIDFFA